MVQSSGNFSSTQRSPVSHLPLMNWMTPTFMPWPMQRITMPKAAVDLPLPLPVWTISRPFSMVLAAIILSRASLRLADFSSARRLRSSASSVMRLLVLTGVCRPNH